MGVIDQMTKSCDMDPQERLNNLLAAIGGFVKQEKETLVLMQDQNAMIKIAITALQTIAIDPTDSMVGTLAAEALALMKDIWDTAQKRKVNHEQEIPNHR